ncbi:hypothetical protein [Gallaecimonas mangrovi]|uniref:hypothetical protein n=1 Tax=Gallaecimonas mangrovi TaxID=2291597 RepID=UPI00126021F7|nr:hypothetical protein [Gallaecimonas mangrovi]
MSRQQQPVPLVAQPRQRNKEQAWTICPAQLGNHLLPGNDFSYFAITPSDGNRFVGLIVMVRKGLLFKKGANDGVEHFKPKATQKLGKAR